MTDSTANRRRSFLVDVWVEAREVRRAAPLLRGRVTSVDSGASSVFATMTQLEALLVEDLRRSGLEQARWAVGAEDDDR